jgi:hypothetical protein
MDSGFPSFQFKVEKTVANHALGLPMHRVVYKNQQVEVRVFCRISTRPGTIKYDFSVRYYFQYYLFAAV